MATPSGIHSFGTVSFLLRQEGVPACARDFTQLGWCTAMPALTCFRDHRCGPWSGLAHLQTRFGSALAQSSGQGLQAAPPESMRSTNE